MKLAMAHCVPDTVGKAGHMVVQLFNGSNCMLEFQSHQSQAEAVSIVAGG